MSTRRSSRRRKSSENENDNDGEDNVEDRVKNITQCVLAAHLRKGALKEGEIKKVLSKDGAHVCEKQMLDVLGCKLRKDGDRLYFNHDKRMPVNEQGERDVLAEAKKGLLSTVLMFIHMSKNPLVKTDKVKEISLWEFLAQLGVRPAAVHPLFGLPSRLIAPANAAEFVAQGWLSFSKVRGADRDAEEVYYDWGQRAYDVIRPMEMLEAFCAVMGDKKEEWAEHLKQAELMERRGGEAAAADAAAAEERD